MKNFEEFAKSIDLGEITFSARKKAIAQADEQNLDDEEELLFVREATSAFTTIRILELYHAWLNQ